MWNGGHSGHPDDNTRRLSIELAIAQHTGNPAPYGYDYAHTEYRGQMQPEQNPGQGGGWSDGGRDSNDKEEERLGRDEAAEKEDEEEMKEPMPPSEARGKPEALAKKKALVAGLVEALKEDLEDFRRNPDGDSSDEEATKKEEGVAKPLDDSMDVDTGTEPVAVVTETVPPAPTPKKKKKKSPAKKKKKANPPPGIPTMDDPVKPISTVEYQNLEKLMVQFCRVPLLAEFSRPVLLLHPELMNVYSKIVHHPVDLGKVCRKIRRRQYESLRDVRLDTWRIFANCVKYHSHPSNKEAVPSFVSIALHLRDYFNDLWQEHILPSDPPKQTGKSNKNSPEVQLRAAFSQRKEDRKKRLVVSGLSVMTGKCLERAAQSLLQLLQNGGCVDKLDTEPIFGEEAEKEDEEISVVVDNLQRLQKRLSDLIVTGDDYGIDELDRDVNRCYTDMVLEDNPSLRMRVANRLDRWIGKIIVPIHEATCRGVSQSSIWGCMAAAVWARESSKKPFWPALVLGIIAPEDQREDWHGALTGRNEARLPEKLRTQLASGKRKAEHAIKRQSLGQMEPQSFFLVEFLGTHEFIWVRESDIVENFDPSDDPNLHAPPTTSKKKRNSRSSTANVIGSKLYASAVEEGKWAVEEFELQLQDVGGDGAEEDDDGEEMNYSYAVLCQSDDEADDEENDEEKEQKPLDIDECNELLATNGMLDFTTAGRKNAKKRAQLMKKQKADAEKKVKADKAKKLKAELSKKKKDAKTREREFKKEQMALEKKRKKRMRERDKALKGIDQQNKKRRVSDSDDLKKSASGRRNLIAGKRDRATAIVEGYLHRAIEQNEYKTLCLGGVMTIPASLVDSSGLLGMALAFRAAAGEIPMPEESGDKNSNIRPWDAIDVDSKKKSSERSQCLEKQIALLEEEIKRVKSATKKRWELCEEVKKGFFDIEDTIKKDDDASRQNPLKKKKKPTPSKDKTKSKAEPENATPEKTEEAAESGEFGDVPGEAEGNNSQEIDEVVEASNDDSEAADDVDIAKTVDVEEVMA